MEITEQDEQHMVIAPTLGERLKWILLSAGDVFFLILILRGFSLLDLPFVVVLSVLALYALGKVIGSKTVIDKLTQSIIVEERHLLLIHRKRVIPLSDVRSVYVDYRKKLTLWGGEWGHPYSSPLRDAWQVSLDVGGEKVKVDHTTNEANMVNLANKVSKFIGKELADKSAKPKSQFKGYISSPRW